MFLPAVTTSAAGAATPRFGAPIVLRAPAPAIGHPDAAVGSSGRVAVTWEDESNTRAAGVFIRRGTTSGRFGAVERLAKTGTGIGTVPSVAVRRDGGVAVAWQPGIGAEVAVAGAHGRFGRPHELVAEGPGSPQILAAGDRYVVFWLDGRRRLTRPAVRYAVSDVAGRFGRARTLAPELRRDNLVTAVDPAGAVIAAWGTPARRGPSAVNQQLAFARLAPGAKTFGATTVLRAAAAEAGAETDTITAAAGPGGAALGWSEQGHLPELLRAAPLTGATQPAPETVFTLDSDDLGKRYAQGPALSLPGGGLPPIAAWSVVDTPQGDFGPTASARVFAAPRRADRTYGDAVPISPPGTNATFPVAAATRSTSIVAWDAAHSRHSVLQYAVRTSNGPFGASREFTRHRTGPTVTFASSPDAVVAVWITQSGSAAGDGISVAILRDPVSRR